jgi:hypothetical protein
MNSGNLIIIGVIVLIIGLLVFVVYTGSPKSGDKRRGTAPGKGYSEHTINIGSTPGASHSVARTYTMRHPKDPQKHAQAMMPAKARKKDKQK